MNEPENPYNAPESPVQPPAVENANGEASRKPGRPYGFWLTTAFALCTIVIWAVAQSLVLLAYSQYTGGELTNEAIEALTNNGFFLGVVTSATTPLAVLVTVFFAWTRVRPNFTLRDYLALRPVGFKTFALWCVIGVVVAFAADFLKQALGYSTVSEFMVESYRTAGSLVLYTIAIVVMAPLWEELLFRGFIFTGYARSPLRVAGAIIVPALAWSAIHLQYEIQDIATIFLLGVTIGVARWRTNSLYVPIAMHFVLNGVALIGMALTEPPPV